MNGAAEAVVAPWLGVARGVDLEDLAEARWELIEASIFEALDGDAIVPEDVLPYGYGWSPMSPASSLVQILLAKLPGPARAQLAAVEDLEAALSAIVERGRAAWPEIALSDEIFVGHLADKLASLPDPVSAFGRVRAEDLYLACACAHGHARALAQFETSYMDRLDVSMKGTPGAPIVDEVKQAVRERLLLATPPKPPRIADFSGQGDLESWLRVAALRVALNIVRAERPRETLEETNLPLSGGGQSEIEMFKRMYRDDFRAAFTEAAAQLTARERNILRHHYIDALSMERIGAMYGVHRNTVQRWMDAARRTLAEETKKALATRLGVDSTELDSIVRLIWSQIHVSVRVFLTEP